MSVYGQVQYAEAAPDVVKDENGMVVGRKLHCYVVFSDHLGACLAKKALMPKAPDNSTPKDQALRVRFAKPQCVVPACTPAFRDFVTAQWSRVTAAVKASPELKKPGCKINALFISKLHQHITSARLASLFGKFGKMIACEVQYHSDGRSAGHGVIIYETIEDAEKALLATNGYRLEGRTIEVTPLRLKKLPSKLEHLKNRIKRQPLSAEGSGSEDGSSFGSSCSSVGGLASPLAHMGAHPGLPMHMAAGMGMATHAHAAHAHAAAAAAAAAAMNHPGLAELAAAGMPMGMGMGVGPMGMPMPMPMGYPGPRPAGELPPGLDLSFLA